MDLESVRALKIEVDRSVVKPAIRELAASRAFGVAAMSLRRMAGQLPTVALGVAAGRKRGEFRLAVRIQRRSLERAGALQEGIRRLAGDDADIRYIGRAIKQQATGWQLLRQRPLLLGASVGHHRITAGTIGAFPRARKTGEVVLLSNNHVLANENRGAIGDPILQQGPRDGGRQPDDLIGELLQFVPLQASGANLVDAAIARLTPEAVNALLEPRLLTDWGEHRGLRTAPLEPGEEVFKVGRTTGLRRGLVSAVEVDDVVVEYETGNLTFDRQIEVEGSDGLPFSSGGDSGSLIVDKDGHACGLLCAGTDQGGLNGLGVTYANELGLVLQHLDLVLEN